MESNLANRMISALLGVQVSTLIQLTDKGRVDQSWESALVAAARTREEEGPRRQRRALVHKKSPEQLLAAGAKTLRAKGDGNAQGLRNLL